MRISQLPPTSSGGMPATSSSLVRVNVLREHLLQPLHVARDRRILAFVSLKWRLSRAGGKQGGSERAQRSEVEADGKRGIEGGGGTGRAG